MYLALRDLRRNWRRFGLVGLVVGLVAVLSTVLSALATGLVSDGISGLRGLPLTHLAFEPGSGAVFTRSTLDARALDEWRRTPGAEASPLGVAFVNAAPTGSGPRLDLALWGVPADSFLVQRADARAALSGPPGLVLSDELEGQVKVGERFTVAGSDLELPVLGFTYAGSYGHVPIAFTSLATWQELHYGNDARRRFSAVALRFDGAVDTTKVDRAAGTETRTKASAYAGSPGFSAETGTMTLIRSFLIVISALIVGAFFTVWTVQRTRQIGLLKALGASNGYAVRDGVGQLALVVVLFTATGAALGALVAGAVGGGDVPVELTLRGTVTTGSILAVVGVLGSVVALRRITTVEPIVALGVEP